MKIALCLSGQLRSVEKGFEYINRNLLSKYDVDVFLNFWKTDKFNAEDNALNLYKPVRWSSQNEFISTYFDRFTRNGGPGWPPRNPYHSYYSVFHANLLKKDQEMISGRYYDYVVRTRFDYALNLDLPFDKVEDGKVYIPADRMNAERNVGSDAFAFGTSKTIDLYSMTYLYLDYLYDVVNCPMNSEEMLAGNLKIHNLIGENLVYVDMNNPFPPDRYGSMQHSFIRDDYEEWSRTNAINSQKN